MISNHTIRDEIKDYWSMRAETFDLQPGHEIFSDIEKNAWLELFNQHLDDAEGRSALDLACGTGVISHLMHELGFVTTGLDWSDAMLTKAREKSESRKSKIRFIMGDAENTLEPEASYDVIVTRHLVWTLVDPAAAFTHWAYLLKPGGSLLIVDGDFVSKNWREKVLSWLQNIAHGFRKPALSKDRKRHTNILSQVYFKNGARAYEVAHLLSQTGFKNIQVQTDLSKIHNAQRKALGFSKFVSRAVQHRYVILAEKSK